MYEDYKIDKTQVTSEGMLEWTLEDDWKDLKEQPQDFGVVSPQFNVDSVNNVPTNYLHLYAVD